MPLTTFGAVKASDIPDIAGVCPDSDQFRNMVNKACRMLMTRGDFWGTVEKIQICVYNSCVVWPDFVGTVLAVNLSKHPTTLYNQWYSFMPLSSGDFCSCGFSYANGRCAGNLKIENDSVSPVPSPIRCGSAVYIRAYPAVLADVGVEVTVYGVDSNGQEVLTQRSDGTWQAGEVLTLSVPYAQSTNKFQEITRLSKPVTEGPVRFYQYDSDAALLYDLGHLRPYETDPMYRRSKIYGLRNSGGCCASSCSTTCGGLMTIEALIKLEFMPVRHDGDLVLVSNQDALRDMIQSIRYADNGDKDQAVKFELSAVHELNLEASNKAPKEQTPIDVNPFGSSLPVFHSIGRIF